MNNLISLLAQNPRLTNRQLAVMLNMPEQEIAERIHAYEQDGIIAGYTAVIDHERLDKDYVEAHIELQVTPKRDLSFEEVARHIAQYEEVKSVCLMSGGHDLAVIVAGNNFKEIALFVSKRLALLDSVVSTKTHFLLKRYKENGTLLGVQEHDERSQ